MGEEAEQDGPSEVEAVLDNEEAEQDGPSEVEAVLDKEEAAQDGPSEVDDVLDEELTYDEGETEQDGRSEVGSAFMHHIKVQTKNAGVAASAVAAASVPKPALEADGEHEASK